MGQKERIKKLEERVKELEVERGLTCEQVAEALEAKADEKAIALSKAPRLVVTAAEMCGNTPHQYRRAARLVRELGEVEG